MKPRHGAGMGDKGLRFAGPFAPQALGELAGIFNVGDSPQNMAALGDQLDQVCPGRGIQPALHREPFLARDLRFQVRKGEAARGRCKRCHAGDLTFESAPRGSVGAAG